MISRPTRITARPSTPRTTEYWTDVWYWKTATEECLDGRTDVACVPYTEWVNAWTKLRS